MKKSLQTRIIDWNRERNGLVLDLDLESRMLAEESKEFFLAESFPHRLQECADFLFVLFGTQAKALSTHPGIGLTRWQEYKALKEWADATLNKMLEVLEEEEVEANGFEGDSARALVSVALGFVTEANEAKGKEQVNGKVVKGPNYRSPLPRIEEFVTLHMKEEDADELHTLN